jgi:hypothetical protein
MQFAFAIRMLGLETDQCIVQALMAALAIVMRHQLSSRCPHRVLSEQDHLLHTRFLDRPYKPSPCALQLGLNGGSLATPAYPSSLASQQSPLCGRQFHEKQDDTAVARVASKLGW